MGIRSILAKPFAAYIASQTKAWSLQPTRSQDAIFESIVRAAQPTLFGKDHDFQAIKSHDDFKKQVPIRDYEDLKGYVEQVVAGKPDILWPGKPAYFAKTSGTTSGTKYIPISKESIPNHI